MKIEFKVILYFAINQFKLRHILQCHRLWILLVRKEIYICFDIYWDKCLSASLLCP